MLPEGTQKVLISAVISNAKTVGEWLNGDPKTVDGQNLLPTHRSVAFASFIDLKGATVRTGWMKYINPQSPEDLDYFVPQVIEKIKLKRKKGESLTKPKYFPNPSEGREIAIFLGLKLVSEGAVAIFCGRKDTASGLCALAAERFSRNLPLATPLDYSNRQEVERLQKLHIENLGSDATPSKSAEHGIFSHHANTPHGIRLAVEYAMREDLVRFVICTSTLAQGINLPIRYLIVTSIYQAGEQIKVRDFHNLIGRAGRSGMHTEGSVIFADPIVYDKRRSRKDSWRWNRVKVLLDPARSEECVSSLFKLVPLVIRNDKNKSNDRREHSLTLDILSFAAAYIEGWDSLNNIVAQVAKQYYANGFTEEVIKAQFEFFSSTLSSIEGFLLSNWDIDGREISETDVTQLAEETLAYFLADEKKRDQIQELFKLLAENISKNINDPSRRKTFGKTLYGVNDAQAIEEWVQSNAAQLFSVVNEKEFLNIVWPLMIKHVHNRVFKKFDKPEVLKEIAHGWIDGNPFNDLLKIIRKRKTKMIWGSRRRKFKIDHTVEVCEGALAYDGALLVSALCEFVEALDQKGTGDLISRLQLFQKRLKFGESLLLRKLILGIQAKIFTSLKLRFCR
jgi:hypothetical protein